ncbi:uncharacterized protein LOC110972585 isoform X2 [Acanthochromis polyacanthus]|uniref:uncharacterized protein LOC110972131 isoform X2 n=1 Tax=Acanthochromis polyacanthus TaxID=80966 RepID=UPI0022348A0D|nr:uncharacterized protein LOC110972131 isoform X2 [Acanthochromis polyacanthus]XP_051810758.1 uncharacterized protein LOC110972585 isoform X2 [Acanthochromis polyacanthus]
MAGSGGPGPTGASDASQVQLRDIINTAQNLVLMLTNSVPANVRPGEQGTSGEAAVGQGVQSVRQPQQAAQQLTRSQNTGLSVKQEMVRSFPGFFQKEARGKRRFTPFRTKESGKSFLVNFFLLNKQYEKTPKGEEELPLMLAGLGKRSLSISENITHSEFSDLLFSAYPRLANICGGWMLHKSTGGGGRRSLVVIPPDLHGYNGQQLKAVSGNGKCTLYISPLQEELDTIPLPPEAKEFENMPKAQCTTCKIMVPLQILPAHIKECKIELLDLSSSADEESCSKEHEDTFQHSICSKADKTAECPVCNNAFQADIIEIHAATCGLRPTESGSHESSGSVPVSTFQSTEEILDWIASKVNEEDRFSICVSRTDLFSRGMQQWQRQKKTSPKCRLKVTFFGEAGVDTGALSREFLTEMLAEIENRLFVGRPDKKGKNPVYCLNSLDSRFFRSAGEVMATSLAQGGPCPNFMREWCFRYLCSSDAESIVVSASDVTDLELSLLVERINNATNDNISDLVDDIVACGYTGVVSTEKRESMTRTVILHSTMRLLPMLDQLRKGLMLYDLPEVMNSHQDLCQKLFIPGEDVEADAAFLLENTRPVYSEIGSAKHQKEVHIMNFLQDYLQEIEDSEHEGPSNSSVTPEGLTVGRIMQWMTGQRHKPVQPSEKKEFLINIQFQHDCDTQHTVCFPTVSACSRTVTFPSAHLRTYSEFKNILTLAVSHGQTFDRV